MRVTIIGSGNVATHMAKAIVRHGHSIDSVCSRCFGHAQTLARETGAAALTDIHAIGHDSDLYIICIADDAIAHVADALPTTDGIVVHTSGATPMGVLQRHARHGVLYPCQTFTRDVQLDFDTVPLLVEASDGKTMRILTDFGRSITGEQVTEATSEQRARVHVAAVLASNFGNHLLTLADEYLQRHGMSIGVLRSLMQQTVAKAFAAGPRTAQTGPARRADQQTIARHLQLIDDENLKTIYKMLSDSINNMYNTNKK